MELRGHPTPLKGGNEQTVRLMAQKQGNRTFGEVLARLGAELAAGSPPPFFSAQASASMAVVRRRIGPIELVPGKR
jgi:hypothetical protein